MVKKDFIVYLVGNILYSVVSIFLINSHQINLGHHVFLTSLVFAPIFGLFVAKKYGEIFPTLVLYLVCIFASYLGIELFQLDSCGWLACPPTYFYVIIMAILFLPTIIVTLLYLRLKKKKVKNS